MLGRLWKLGRLNEARPAGWKKELHFDPPKPPPAKPVWNKPMRDEALVRRLTLEEAQARAGIANPDHPSMPSRVAEWERFTASMLPDDEFWAYCTPKWTWQALAGRAGIALVRDNKVVAKIITMLN